MQIVVRSKDRTSGTVSNAKIPLPQTIHGQRLTLQTVSMNTTLTQLVYLQILELPRTIISTGTNLYAQFAINTVNQTSTNNVIFSREQFPQSIDITGLSLGQLTIRLVDDNGAAVAMSNEYTLIFLPEFFSPTCNITNQCNIKQ
jgi:hypothetical protein